MDNTQAIAVVGEVPKTFWNEFDVSGLLPTVGTYELTERERDILYAPIDPAIVEIRGFDGIVYIPHAEVTNRWTAAFGLGWGLIPQGMPRMQDNLMIWGFYLIIRGHLVGFAIGGQKYVPSNVQMTFDDAAEGAKSIATTRLGKAMGMFPELWTPSFIRDWKAKFAEQAGDKWRKKVSAPVKPEDFQVSVKGKILTLTQVWERGEEAQRWLRLRAEQPDEVGQVCQEFLKTRPEETAKEESPSSPDMESAPPTVVEGRVVTSPATVTTQDESQPEVAPQGPTTEQDIATLWGDETPFQRLERLGKYQIKGQKDTKSLAQMASEPFTFETIHILSEQGEHQKACQDYLTAYYEVNKPPDGFVNVWGYWFASEQKIGIRAWNGIVEPHLKKLPYKNAYEKANSVRKHFGNAPFEKTWGDVATYLEHKAKQAEAK